MAAKPAPEIQAAEFDLAAERKRFEREEAEAAAAEKVDLLQVIEKQEVALAVANHELDSASNMPEGAARDKAMVKAANLLRDAVMFPIEIASWQILIEMVRPKDKMGIFHKVESQVQAEQYLTVVGRVLMVGPTAFEGKTSSGIQLSHLTNTISHPDELVGKYVIMQRYTGNDLYFAPMPGKKLRIITLTEILAVTTMASLWMKG